MPEDDDPLRYVRNLQRTYKNEPGICWVDDPAERRRVRDLAEEVVGLDGPQGGPGGWADLRSDWLRSRGWAAVVGYGPLSVFADGVCAAAQRLGYEDCWGVKIEADDIESGSPYVFRVPLKLASFRNFLSPLSLSGVLFIPNDQSFALINGDDNYQVAGTVAFVEDAIGMSVAEAHHEFRADAETESYPPLRKMLLDLAERYAPFDGAGGA